MKYYARVTQVTFMNYTVTVIECKKSMPTPGPNHEITVGLRNAITGEPGNLHVTLESMAAAIEQIPTVNAYEILDGRGNGVSVNLMHDRFFSDE